MAAHCQSKIQTTALTRRGLLRVAGASARPFLQGLVTNDVEQVNESTPIYAALLTPQGKFLHDFLIVQIGDALVLDLEAERLQDLLRRLTMYRLRAAVDLVDVSKDLSVFAVFGEEADGLGDKLPGTFVRDPRSTVLGHRLYSVGDSPPDFAAIGAKIVGTEAYDAFRISAGVPDGSRDIPVEKAFPLEYGFDSLGAVSYEKGCYIGQELTARTHNRGKVKKALYRVRFETNVPTAGTAIRSDNTEVGEVLTGAGQYGLAHLRIDAAEANQQLHAGTSLIVERVEAPVAPPS
jgi:folate-binding protein YgfZ